MTDDPTYDNTEGAHPAFWRGQDDGIAGVCRAIRRALDGKDAGVCNEPLESVRRDVLRLREDRRRLVEALRGLYNAQNRKGLWHAADEAAAKLLAEMEG